MMADIMLTLSTWALPVIIAITFHEAAHGYVAHLFGDDTAKRLGRVSFNPARHVDPFGTIILPLILFLTRSPFLFGYAKPVPVDFRNLRNPKKNMVWVALAGPGINMILAIAAGFLVHLTLLLPEMARDWFVANMINAIQINLLLALFNMLPIPPLDGGRVAVGLLPPPLSLPLARLEPYGMFILIGLLFLVPLLGAAIGQNWSFFAWAVLPPFEFLYSFILQHIVGVTPGP